MPAAVVKGIIISISIITALGIAVLENPQVQVWLEEQRRKIAELLRSIGEDLDPESRRQAEAFAYEGRTPASDAGLRREASGSREAAAIATGRSLSGSSNVSRRIPVRGPADPNEAEERRRKGREYLAKRNQQMIELKEKRNGAGFASGSVTPTSFDDLVNMDGKLKEDDIMAEDPPIQLPPSPPAVEPIPEDVRIHMRDLEQPLAQPLLAGESSTVSEGFRAGSSWANPFSDEYALERSETPRPPLPPKIALDQASEVSQDVELTNVPPMPYSPSLPPIQTQEEPQGTNHEELTYEEQLAIALSLSEAESASSATVRQRPAEEDDAELKAAIAASLKDMDSQQAAHAIANNESATPQPRPVDPQPLVDLTPPSPRIVPARQARDWERLFDPQFSPSQEPLTLNEPAPSEASDELYRVTPELTRARLASFDAQQQQIAPPPEPSNTPYDPVREAADSHTLSPEPQAMEASFYSAPSSVSLPPSSQRSQTLEQAPELINVEDVPEGARTPTTHGFHSDSDSETFASLSRTISQAPSEISNIEVVDLEDDSDVDMLSEEGNGVSTPDSWTEVGSRDGESEAGDFEPPRAAL